MGVAVCSWRCPCCHYQLFKTVFYWQMYGGCTWLGFFDGCLTTRLMIMVITSVDLVHEPASGNNDSTRTLPIWYELRQCQPYTLTSLVGTCVGWFFNPVRELCWFFNWLYGLGSWTQYQPGMKRKEKPGTRTWLACSKVQNPKPKTKSGHHQCWSIM
jgi:hypothetical protein